MILLSADSAPTLAHRLAELATLDGAAVAVRYSADGHTWTQLTYAELYRRAGLLATRLRHGQLAVIALPSGLDYIVAFYACLIAGATAVTFYLPGLLTFRAARAFATRLDQVLDDCRPTTVLTCVTELDRYGLSATSFGPGRSIIDVPSAGALSNGALAEVRAQPGELALVQYTSGSTATPKGIMISHGNLRHNVSRIGGGLTATRGESVTSWLPLYHDLGLIGAVLYPLWNGMTLHLLSPAAFLRRPRVWFDTVSRTRSVLTMAPDFAYALLARRLAGADLRGLDLSCLRHAVIAAEPIRPQTIEAVQKVFEPAGMSPDSMLPAYGLAEHTVCASTFARRQPPPVLRIPGEAAGGGTVLVGCGRPIDADSAIAIVDPAARAARPDGEIGEIWLAGPSVAQGYWGRPELSARTFANRLGDDDRSWLRTGDLGLICDGVLYVVGRSGEAVVRNGVNHFLHDIEFTAGASHRALEPGGAAAFTDHDLRIVLVQELHGAVAAAERPRIVSAIRQAVAEEHGLRLDTVVLVRRGKVPRTTSGKTRRNECAHLWRAGELDHLTSSALDPITAGGRA